MYNHYIPQSDGSYRRNPGPEQRRPTKTKLEPEKPKPEPERPPEPPKQALPCKSEQPQQGILDFLKGLLPRQIDTADLIIVFLLLLMNQEEDCGMSPILTLALYFLL